MRISIVEDMFYPSALAVRTRKMAGGLSEFGHDVTIFARGKGSNEQDTRAPVNGLISNDRFASRLLSYPVPINPLWYLWLLQSWRKNTPDVVIARNLRIGLPALAAAAKLGLPRILDLSEHYPAMVSYNAVNSPSLARRLKYSFLLNRCSVSLVEKLTLGLANCVWVTSREHQAVIARAGQEPQQISVVRNTPRVDGCTETDRQAKGIEFVLAYVGLVNHTRHLDLVIKALPQLLETGVPVRLIIGGLGDHLAALRQLGASLGVAEAVDFLGWVHPPQVLHVISVADVGLLPHRPCEYIDITLPNKLFDYMMLGLPVLATPQQAVTRVIQETGCGRVVPDDPSSFADAVIELWEDQDELVQLGSKGHEAFASKYNWNVDLQTIMRDLDRLAPSVGNTGQRRSQ
jgi:glycosyltransferase involved in cell wall biosynthesis